MKKLDWVRRQEHLQKGQPPAPDLWPWLKEKNLAWGCPPQVIQAIECLGQGAPAVVT
jgi:hypothetical protein